MTDDLSAPLGKRRPVKRRFAFARVGAYLVMGLLLSPLLGFAGWTFMVDDPLGGEPMASAGADVRALSPVKKPDEARIQTASTPDASLSEVTPASPPPGTRVVTIIDGTSGRRQNIFVPDSDPNIAPPDSRMTEYSRKVSKNGPDSPRPAKPVAARPAIP